MIEEDRLPIFLELERRYAELSAGLAAPMSADLSDYADAARKTREAANEVTQHIRMALDEIEGLSNDAREVVIRTLLGWKTMNMYGPLAGYDVLMALRCFCIEKCEEADPNWQLPDWADPPGFFETIRNLDSLTIGDDQ